MHQPPTLPTSAPSPAEGSDGAVSVALGSIGRLARAVALAAVLALPLALGGQTTQRASAAPASPTWPEPGLIDAVRGLLAGYYGQAGDPADFPAELGNCLAYTYVLLAPETTADMPAAWKDPDRLWEAAEYCEVQALGPGAGGTGCHAATTEAEAVDCTGHRVARGLGASAYAGGTSLYDPNATYYGNRALALAAGEGALYHAFVHDFHAPNGPRRPADGTCPPAPAYGPGGARNHRCYHKRLLRAYERHQHAIVLDILTRPRPDAASFQLSASREAGLLALSYARTVQTVEELGAWSPSTGAADRRDAIALVNALNQRLWWEWVWANQSGPLTAGIAQIGAQDTFDAAAKVPAWSGADRFTIGALPPIRSLRQFPTAGVLFDADYAMPGAGWCAQFAPGDPSRTACEAHAAGLATHSQGPNLGSIAEEWLWTFAGARAGMSLVEALMLGGSPDLPASGAIGANRTARFPGVGNVADRPEYAIISDRLGFGVAGWHGGGALTDDLEWPWAPTGGAPATTAIRTLSAGEHDGEPQAGRVSLGENDGKDGGRYATDGQEAAGGIENHYPGPSALYGTALWQLTLEDRTGAGLSASSFDYYARNTPDEFNAWLWLLRSTIQRCRGAGISDPADPRCAALGGPDIEQLYVRPNTVPSPTVLDAQWRGHDGPQPPIPAAHLGTPELTACGYKAGVPWRRHGQLPAVGPQNAPTMVDEVGGDAWSNLVPTFAGALRVLAARYAVEPEPAARAEQAAWYGDVHAQLEGLIAHYGGGGLGHVPALEHSSCLVPAGNSLASLLAGSPFASVQGVLATRALNYTRLVHWYAWLDGHWLDIDPGVWDGVPMALPRVTSAVSPRLVQTGIQIQNLDAVQAARSNVALFRQGTANAVLELHPDLAPGGSRNLFLDASNAANPNVLLDGGARTPLQAADYGAVVRSDRSVGAIVRFDWPSTKGAALFTDAPAAPDLVVPWVVRGVSGRATEVTVQNVGTAMARFVATFYALGSSVPSASVSAIIPPAASRPLDLTSLPPGFAGWALIRSETTAEVPPAYHAQPLAAYSLVQVDPISHPFPVSAAFGTEGQPANPPTSTLFVPLWRARQVVGATTLDTSIALANPGTTPVDVTVTFQRSPLAETCQTVPGGWSTSTTFALPAKGSRLLDQAPAVSGLPTDCFGSATIEVDPPIGRVIATVIDETEQPAGPMLISAFNALPSTAASTRVALPLYRRNWANLTTGIQVVNVGDVPVTADVTFVPAVGGGGPVTVSRPIAARDSANWWPGSLPQVPEQTYGSAVVTATGPVVVLVNDYPLQDGLDPATYLGLASP